MESATKTRIWPATPDKATLVEPPPRSFGRLCLTHAPAAPRLNGAPSLHKRAPPPRRRSPPGRVQPSPATAPDCRPGRQRPARAARCPRKRRRRDNRLHRPQASAVNAPTWFEAISTAMVGRPRQQRSQHITPPAPMARSALAISSAMLSAPRCRVARPRFRQSASTASACGLPIPIATSTPSSVADTAAMAASAFAVSLEGSEPPKQIRIRRTSPLRGDMRLRVSANSGRSSA